MDIGKIIAQKIFRKLQICLDLRKKCSMESFMFCVVDHFPFPDSICKKDFKKKVFWNKIRKTSFKDTFYIQNLHEAFI